MKKIDVNIVTDDIEHTYRIGNKLNKRKGPVIIKFKREETKIAVLRKKRDLKFNKDTDFIKINEQLTSFSYKLLIEARKRLSSKYKYIWTREGRILLKENDTSTKQFELISFDQIEKFI